MGEDSGGGAASSGAAFCTVGMEPRSIELECVAGTETPARSAAFSVFSSSFSRWRRATCSS
jgi:hypothetical protein